jgi:uncharacterized protein (TIGR01244 family)
MQAAQATPDFSVSPQIGPDDFPEIARLGFRVVINNRPDGEEFGQMSDLEARAAAEAAGLTYFFAPFRGAPTTEAIQVIAEARKAGGPVFAYCRSGTRSITAWAAEQARGGAAVDQVLAQVRAAGYDLSGMRQVLLDYSNR